MDLSDSELYWTRKKNNLVDEEETKRYIRSLEKKVDNLEKIEQEHQKENGELREIVKELEEENKLQRQQLNSAFDNGFIHKDKIREKIEELDSIYQQEIKQKYNGRYYHQLSYAIQILKELLQEGK